MSDLFDFSQVAAATSTGYLEPGMYNLTPTEVKFESPSGKTPYVQITFANKEGSIVRENFYLTPKAMGRLQYLHKAWFDRELTKAFKSVEEIAAYFEKVMTMKKITKPTIVGGTVGTNGKIYGNLPYTNFVLPDSATFDEGKFEEGSSNYKEYVKKSNLTSAASMSDSSLLPGSDEDEKDEDAPW